MPPPLYPLGSRSSLAADPSVHTSEKHCSKSEACITANAFSSGFGLPRPFPPAPRDSARPPFAPPREPPLPPPIELLTGRHAISSKHVSTRSRSGGPLSAPAHMRERTATSEYAACPYSRRNVEPYRSGAALPAPPASSWPPVLVPVLTTCVWSLGKTSGRNLFRDLEDQQEQQNKNNNG